MTSATLASNIMTTNVVVAGPKTKYSEVMEFFTVHRIQHLPVAENDKLLGILSVNDMARYMHRRAQVNLPMNIASLDAAFDIDTVMTKNPTCVNTDDTLDKVLSILAEGKFQALPVIKDDLIHGIITNKDIVRHYSRRAVQ